MIDNNFDMNEIEKEKITKFEWVEQQTSKCMELHKNTQSINEKFPNNILPHILQNLVFLSNRGYLLLWFQLFILYYVTLFMSIIAILFYFIWKTPTRYSIS